MGMRVLTMGVFAGDDLTAYVEKLGWTLDASTGVVSIPPNPDNQIESTVVQENIQLPRAFLPLFRPIQTTHLIPLSRAHKSHRARSADLTTRCTRCVD